MKSSLWFLTFEFTATCLACWILSWLVIQFGLHDFAEQIPAFTKLALFPNVWIPFCPLPWLVYAIVLSRRQELSRRAMLLFNGTILLATILLLCVVVIASILPFMADARPMQ